MCISGHVLKKIRAIIQSLYLPVTDVAERETESRYLAATNLDALRLQSILPTFLQSYNYNNNFISNISPYYESNKV